MSRHIKIPHEGGLINYKGEDRNLFSEIMASEDDYIVVNYFGDSDESVWETTIVTPLAIPMPTLEWLREHLKGNAEFAASLSDDVNVTAFMRMVDRRARDKLILTDADYAMGVAALYSNSVIDLTHAESLLALGNHNPTTYGIT